MTILLNNIIAANVTPANATMWCGKLNLACTKYVIDTPLRVAHFLAQIAHESAGLAAITENLNYSADRLVAVFPKYFPTLISAQPYARKPQKIANKIYGNRMGNGDELSGDGWKYRGRGFIQLTGRNNYRQYGYEDNPDVIDPADSAAWYWSTRALNPLADQDDVVSITKKINGGLNGLDDRKSRLAKIKASLGIQ
jgi:putative chitinase